MDDGRSIRPMTPDFDPFPLDVPDGDPTPPIVVGYVEGADGTRSCESDDEMADWFGAPVFLPRQWPAGTLVERRLVIRPGPPPSGRDRSYVVTARHPYGESPMLVHGYFGASPYHSEADGCRSPEELAEVDGVVFESAGYANLSIVREGLCVLLLHFPSAESVISSAQSIERCAPPGRPPERA